MGESPMDQSLSCWILEYLLRQPTPNPILHSIFLALPLPTNPSSQIPNFLIRSILLRRIASDPISLRSLSSLELLHELNLHDPDTHFIQFAYFQVAVGSTLMFLTLGDVPGFLDAVESIWVKRVGDLEASGGNGLVSEELLNWKRRIEMAAGSERAREEVIKEWRVEMGVAAVREFLVKELEAMGPTRLEMAGREMIDRGKEGNLIRGGEKNGGGQVTVSFKGVDGGDCIANQDGDISNGFGVDEERSYGQVVEQGEVRVSKNETNGGDCIVNKEVELTGGERSDSQAEQEEVDMSLRKIGNGDCIANEEVETSDNLCRSKERTDGGQAEEGEVGASSMRDVSGNCIVIEYRESSCGLGRHKERTIKQMEKWEVHIRSNGVDNDDCIANEENETLDNLGSGPERIDGQVELGDLGINLGGIDYAKISVPSAEVNNVKANLKRSRVDLKNAVVDPLPDAKTAAARITKSKLMNVLHHEQETENQNKADVSAPSQSADKGSEGVNIEPNKHLKLSGHSLLDQNPTARTYEFEDETNGSQSDNASSLSKKLHLPTPRATKVSPLKLVEVRKVGRKRKRWSLEEEDALREAVNKHGKGNWKIILNDNRKVFQDRTEVDLKDKWRNMTKP